MESTPLKEVGYAPVPTSVSVNAPGGKQYGAFEAGVNGLADGRRARCCVATLAAIGALTVLVGAGVSAVWTVDEIEKRIGDNGVGQLSWSYVATGSTVAAKVTRRNALQANITMASGVPASFSQEALHSAVAGGTVCCQSRIELERCCRNS